MRAELSPAYQWKCPGCGAAHFEQVTDYNGCTIGFVAEMKRIIARVHESNGWLLSPVEVTCRNCGQKCTTTEAGVKR